MAKNDEFEKWLVEQGYNASHTQEGKLSFWNRKRFDAMEETLEKYRALKAKLAEQTRADEFEKCLTLKHFTENQILSSPIVQEIITRTRVDERRKCEEEELGAATNCDKHCQAAKKDGFGEGYKQGTTSRTFSKEDVENVADRLFEQFSSIIKVCNEETQKSVRSLYVDYARSLLSCLNLKREEDVRTEEINKKIHDVLGFSKYREEKAVINWLESKDNPIRRFVYDSKKNLDDVTDSQEFGYRLANTDAYNMFHSVIGKLQEENKSYCGICTDKGIDRLSHPEHLPMNIIEAATAMKQGKKVRRKIYNPWGKPYYMQTIEGDGGDHYLVVSDINCGCGKGEVTKERGFSTIDDLLASDWEIVE